MVEWPLPPPHSVLYNFYLSSFLSSATPQYQQDGLSLGTSAKKVPLAAASKYAGPVQKTAASYLFFFLRLHMTGQPFYLLTILGP